VISWRNAAIVLAVVCGVQRWQSCTRSDSTTTTTVVERDAPARTTTNWREAVANSLTGDTKPAAKTFYGMHIPTWAARLLPQPGEKMRDYRDRIVPLAQLAIAPQRARVARMRDNFTSLGEKQRTELDAAVGEAATAIEDRVKAAVVSGDLNTLKPMTGVTMARDVLDIVDKGNTRFVTSLTPEQRTEMASNRFDFADYLLFSTPWEDALGTK
jgi:hypothetical protein